MCLKSLTSLQLNQLHVLHSSRHAFLGDGGGRAGEGGCFNKKVDIFLISAHKRIVGTHLKPLAEALWMSIHNKGFHAEIRKIFTLHPSYLEPRYCIHSDRQPSIKQPDIRKQTYIKLSNLNTVRKGHKHLIMHSLIRTCYIVCSQTDWRWWVGVLCPFQHDLSHIKMMQGW